MCVRFSNRMSRRFLSILMTGALAAALCASGERQDRNRRGDKPHPVSAVDRMIEESEQRQGLPGLGAAPGSIYSPQAAMAEGFRDLRAARVDDIVTVVVADRASAVSSGTAASQRKGSASGGVGSIFGRSVAPLADLASLSGERKLDASGATGRESALSTTLTARVTRVLPNGSLVIEADKEVAVNSERQQVHIRGVIRPFDVSTANTVPSDRIANLELRINGRGVVGDAVQRPNILYRILTGLLPF